MIRRIYQLNQTTLTSWEFLPAPCFWTIWIV